MKEFKTVDEIFSYLNDKRDDIEIASNNTAAKILYPIFASELTNDPKVMMEVYQYIDLEIDTDFGYIIRDNQKLLKNADLNLYKFKILCSYRGPLDEEQFLDYIADNTSDEYIMEAAKHKDFPPEGKTILFEKYNDISYLPNEAQEMFVF